MKTPGPARAWHRVLVAALFATFVLGAVFVPAAHATIYKWIDADGNVGFTDNPENIPNAYRDTATSMSEDELARRVPIQQEAPADLEPIRIPGYVRQRPQISRRFEAPLGLGWGTKSNRQAYVPNLGFLEETGTHGPSEHSGFERDVYINGDRYLLKNPHPVEGEMNWADRENLEHVFGPAVRQPELDLYIGGYP